VLNWKWLYGHPKKEKIILHEDFEKEDKSNGNQPDQNQNESRPVQQQSSPQQQPAEERKVFRD
jgi:hypothetical protein